MKAQRTNPNRWRRPSRRNLFESFIDEAKREYDRYLESDEVTVLIGDGYDADITHEPDSPSAQMKRKLMGKVLQKIREAVDARGIPLALLFIPSPMDVCKDYYVRVNREIHRGYVDSRATDTLEEIAKRNHIPYINLFTPFEEADCSSLFYHHGQHHWNEIGQALAAAITADYILSNNLWEARGKAQ